jgi:hypothetical protein
LPFWNWRKGGDRLSKNLGSQQKPEKGLIAFLEKRGRQAFKKFGKPAEARKGVIAFLEVNRWADLSGLSQQKCCSTKGVCYRSGHKTLRP